MSSNANTSALNSTAQDLLVEASLLLNSGRKVVVFVEGDSDRRVYEHLFKQSVSVLPANNCGNVEHVINLYNCSAHKISLPKIVGVVDRDYRIAARQIFPNPNLICTELRDIECEMIDTPAFTNVIAEYCCQKFRTTWPQPNTFRNLILNATAGVGSVRMYNHVKVARISFRKLDFERVHNFKSHHFDGEMLIGHLRGAQDAGAKLPANFQEVSRFIADKKFQKHVTPLRLSRGHDVFELVALYLQKGFGRNNIDVKASTLESAIRIGFVPYMHSSPTVKKIVQWFKQESAENYLAE